MQQHQQHHVDQNLVTAFIAGPIALVAFAILAIVLQDAPVAHAAHSALAGH